jgi:thioredoxin-like negative regulator of GroEL
MATAAATHQPVFVHFSAPWCEPCQRMKRDLYTRPDVASRLDRFVRVEVDTDTPAGAQAWMDYRLPGLPVVAFLRSDGAELPDQRLTGVPSEARLLTAMDAALSLNAADAPPAAALPAPRTEAPSSAPASAPLGDSLLIGLLGLAGLLGAGLLALRWRRGALRGRRASSGSPPPSR